MFGKSFNKIFNSAGGSDVNISESSGIDFSGRRAKIRVKSGPTCTVNGVEVSGQNITIEGNQVFVDGKPVEVEQQKQITITINGDCDSVETTSGDVTVSGVAGSVKTMSGDVDVVGSSGIKGSVKTMSGDVSANGTIGGNVSTMSGDIRHK